MGRSTTRPRYCGTENSKPSLSSGEYVAHLTSAAAGRGRRGRFGGLRRALRDRLTPPIEAAISRTLLASPPCYPQSSGKPREIYWSGRLARSVESTSVDLLAELGLGGADLQSSSARLLGDSRVSQNSSWPDYWCVILLGRVSDVYATSRTDRLPRVAKGKLSCEDSRADGRRGRSEAG